MTAKIGLAQPEMVGLENRCHLLYMHSIRPVEHAKLQPHCCSPLAIRFWLLSAKRVSKFSVIHRFSLVTLVTRACMNSTHLFTLLLGWVASNKGAEAEF